MFALLFGAASVGLLITGGPRTCLRPRASCVGPIMQAGPGGDSWSPNYEHMLRNHIANTGASVARSGACDIVMQGLNSAFVLIFNAGQQDEGVYTLQGRQERAASYVLAFERSDDAERFAQLLHAEGFDLAMPAQWNAVQLSTFCDAGAFEVSLVPEGTLITPPTRNEYDRDAFDRLGGGSGDIAHNPEDIQRPKYSGSDYQAQIQRDVERAEVDRRYPGDGTGRPDPFAAARKALEGTLYHEAEDCGVDEGCELPPTGPTDGETPPTA